MTMRNQKGQLWSTNQTYIAQSVSAYMQPLGITDRKALEEITNLAIQRLEGILPGMERLITPDAKQQLSDEQIVAVINEILQERNMKQIQAEPVINPVEHKARISENAMVVLEKRYWKKDRDGKVIETPEELFYRVAHHIASAELKYNSDADISRTAEEFYKIMVSLEFLPNSPTLMNAGRELGQLSACFVIPVEDSMESIFDAVKYTALIHKSGGGAGFFFFRVRPSKDRGGSPSGICKGPPSFFYFQLSLIKTKTCLQ